MLQPTMEQKPDTMNLKISQPATYIKTKLNIKINKLQSNRAAKGYRRTPRQVSARPCEPQRKVTGVTTSPDQTDGGEKLRSYQKVGAAIPVLEKHKAIYKTL